MMKKLKVILRNTPPPPPPQTTINVNRHMIANSKKVKTLSVILDNDPCHLNYIRNCIFRSRTSVAFGVISMRE